MTSTQMLYNCFSPSCRPAKQDNDTHLEHIAVCLHESLFIYVSFAVFVGLCVADCVFVVLNRSLYMSSIISCD